MAKAKNSFIDEELEFLEQRAKEIKQDVEANPYDEIRDRIVSLDGPNGSSEKVVATEEAQKKAMREALREYAQIIEIINNLREKEAAKLQTKGDAQISTLGKEFLKNR